MKAEAPEKIFLEREKGTDIIHHLWGRTPVVSSFYEHIEYVRADAFIDKAEKYLKDQFIKDVSVLAAGVISISFSTAIKNFVNYMKS